MRVIGIDQSLVSTGLAVTSGPGVMPLLVRIRTGKLRGHERLAVILAAVSQHADGCGLAVLERVINYPGKGDAPLVLSGLGWLIRHALWQAGIPYAVISPPERAKFITGSGGASKDEVMAAAIRRFGPEAGIMGNDVADALVFAAMGCEWLGEPIVELPAAQRAVIRSVHTEKGKRGQPKIIWPDLRPAETQGVLLA